MPDPDVAKSTTPSNPIGARSILYLVLSYRTRRERTAPFNLDRFERELAATGRWRRRGIDDTGLLPHMDVQVREGIVIRAFEASGEIANMFDPRATWHFEKPRRRAKGDKPASERGDAPSVQVKIVGAPTLYALKTGYVFMVLGVRPIAGTLKDFQDAYARIVRKGWCHLSPERLPRKKASAAGDTRPHWWALEAEARGLEETSIRHWLAMLVPGLDPSSPQGSREPPMAVNTLFVRQPLSRGAEYRIRLAHDDNQIDPPPPDEELDAAAAWRPSATELCLFSSLGVTWVVESAEPEGFLARFDEVVRDRYLYKWILVEHQRLFLIWLSAMCAKMSDDPDPGTFRWLRLELLGYTATGDFGHISAEERHDKFYRALRRALDIEGLFEEVKEEINEINEHLSAEREAVLNEVLAFLTLVLTPMGLVIGIYQRETLPPEEFQLSFLWTASAWVRLLRWWPLWFVIFAGVAGFFVFTRVLGAGAVRRLLERIRHGGKPPRPAA